MRLDRARNLTEVAALRGVEPPKTQCPMVASLVSASIQLCTPEKSRAFLTRSSQDARGWMTLSELICVHAPDRMVCRRLRRRRRKRGAGGNFTTSVPWVKRANNLPFTLRTLELNFLGGS